MRAGFSFTREDTQVLRNDGIPAMLLFDGVFDKIVSIKVGGLLGACRLFCHPRGYLTLLDPFLGWCRTFGANLRTAQLQIHNPATYTYTSLSSFQCVLLRSHLLGFNPHTWSQLLLSKSYRNIQDARAAFIPNV